MFNKPPPTSQILPQLVQVYPLTRLQNGRNMSECSQNVVLLTSAHVYCGGLRLQHCNWSDTWPNSRWKQSLKSIKSQKKFELSLWRLILNPNRSHRPSPYRAVNTLRLGYKNQSKLYREIMAVCSKIHTKHINTVCGQNVELLNVKLAVHIVTTGL